MHSITHKLLVTLILAAIGTAATTAQNMRRSTPSKPRRTASHPKPQQIVVEYDTVASPAVDSIAIADFEKPLRSMRESMTVHNHTSRQIVDVELDMVYTDMNRRMIHRARHTVNAMIPAGESRRIDVPTFDSSASFYYRKSNKPRYTNHATPFDVDVTVIYITQPLLNSHAQ